MELPYLPACIDAHVDEAYPHRSSDPKSQRCRAHERQWRAYKNAYDAKLYRGRKKVRDANARLPEGAEPAPEPDEVDFEPYEPFRLLTPVPMYVDGNELKHLEALIEPFNQNYVKMMDDRPSLYARHQDDPEIFRFMVAVDAFMKSSAHLLGYFAALHERTRQDRPKYR